MKDRIIDISEDSIDKISGGDSRNQLSYGPESYKYKAICASCGMETPVPFPPKEGRPIYCVECFRKMNGD